MMGLFRVCLVDLEIFSLKILGTEAWDVADWHSEGQGQSVSVSTGRKKM